MRIVTTPDFCKACLEGLWISLLKRVNLIDSLTESCTRKDSSTTWVKSLNLDLVPLAQFREDGPINDEVYAITWKKDGVVMDKFKDKTYINVDDEESLGQYTVSVKFSTDEVRVDEEGRLQSSVEHNITTHCQDTYN